MSGGGNHGTVEGATFTVDRFGNPNSAYSFDGLNDRILFGDVEPVTGNAISIQAWFRTNSLGGLYWEYDRPIVSKLFYNVEFYLGGSVYDDERIEFVLFDSQSGVFSNDLLNDNKWHQAVGVYDGSLVSDNIKLYIDGQLQDHTASFHVT